MVHWMAEGPAKIDTTNAEETGGNTSEVFAPALCIAFEAARPFEPPSRHFFGGTGLVELGRSGTGRRVVRREGADRSLSISIPDSWLSRNHALLRHESNAWFVEDLGSKNGTFVNGRPVRRQELEDGDVLEVGHTFLVFRDRVPFSDHELADLQLEPSKEPDLASLNGGFAGQIRVLESIALSRVSVVLRGEVGTGKEVAARALHRLSGRSGPFVAINCGGLPATLIESELFGYRKGAFSGALEDRPGLIRSAHQGTLFLDEIADLPLTSQATLLRVLQESEVQPLGSTRPVRVDVRWVVASHRDLDEMVSTQEFRLDLLTRLSGFTFLLPPLRERIEDLGLLSASILLRQQDERAVRLSFSLQAGRHIFAHRWPGNVRELDKALCRALALMTGDRLEEKHLPRLGPAAVRQGSLRPRARQLSPEDEKRRAALVALLREHHGNMAAVARAMGLEASRTQVYRWVERFGLDPNEYRP
jgi:sigma-54 dependent transcriptional regulator, acetoin dehydrogenase operon transcriptional activator AcoR